MNILVTGGAGFIGSTLSTKLLKQGHSVTIIDDLSLLSKPILAWGSVFIHGDVCNIANLTIDKYDKIFHLAAEAHIQPSFENPLRWNKSNILGTAAVMEYARKSKSGIVVYSTTSSKNHGTPYLTPYTYSKVAGEGILKTYAYCYNTNCAMATFYNVYGPNEHKEGEWGTVVGKFGRQYKNNEKITIVGDGQQKRDFTHVDDIVDGLIKISEGDYRADNFDLGRGCPISILELAQMFTTDESKIDFIPKRKNEGDYTIADTEDTFKRLGWKATKNLSDYVNELKSNINEN
jgi:UDP-glucose 4-epimerase